MPAEAGRCAARSHVPAPSLKKTPPCSTPSERRFRRDHDKNWGSYFVSVASVGLRCSTRSVCRARGYRRWLTGTPRFSLDLQLKALRVAIELGGVHALDRCHAGLVLALGLHADRILEHIHAFCCPSAPRYHRGRKWPPKRARCTFFGCLSRKSLSDPSAYCPSPSSVVV